MPKKENKKSWKEIQRERQLKQQRAQESDRIRLEVERKYNKEHKGWPVGKVVGAIFLIALILVAYVAWQSSIPPSTIGSGAISPSPTTPSTSPLPPSTPASTLLAPDFSLEDVNGTKIFSLNQHSGEVIAIHFMGLFGCSAQLYQINENQLQELRTVYDTYCGKKPVTIVTVGMATCAGCDDYLAQVRDYFGITWTLGNDYDDEKLDIIQAYTTKFSIYDGTIVLVDKKSNVAEVYTDPITAAGLSARIDQLLLV